MEDEKRYGGGGGVAWLALLLLKNFEQQPPTLFCESFNLAQSRIAKLINSQFPLLFSFSGTNTSGQYNS